MVSSAAELVKVGYSLCSGRSASLSASTGFIGGAADHMKRVWAGRGGGPTAGFLTHDPRTTAELQLGWKQTAVYANIIIDQHVVVSEMPCPTTALRIASLTDLQACRAGTPGPQLTAASAVHLARFSECSKSPLCVHPLSVGRSCRRQTEVWSAKNVKLTFYQFS